MKRRIKITIEYPLATKSPGIVWGLIGSAAGLQKWIANYVTEDKSHMTFTWGEAWTEQDTHTSEILEKKTNKYIRLKWDYIEEEEAYWEMRIEKSEMTEALNLVITDYAYPDDTDYLHNLWDDNLNRLHQISGL